VLKWRKNDDEQEQFVAGPAQSGSGEVFAFHIEKVIIHVEGGFFQHSFWLETSISKHYRNYPRWWHQSPKTFIVIG